MSTVVIPAAGRGTRFAPYTNLVPKELLPILNRPALDYILDECALAALQNIIAITHKSKPLINNYFKEKKINCIDQSEPLGLGHAILMAQSAIKDAYFGICLPDDIIITQRSCIGALRLLSEHYQASIIAVQKVAPESVDQYGIISIKQELDNNLFELNDLIEKPQAQDAPSLYGIVGRYWLSQKIFVELKSITSGTHQELQLTDAIRELILHGHKVLAYEIPEIRYDIGTPTGWLQANNYFAQFNRK